MPDSAQKAVSDLLYRAILPVCTRMMARDTEWKEVDKNWAGDVVSDCNIFYFSYLFPASGIKTLI